MSWLSGSLRSIFDTLPDVAGILLATLSLSLIFLPKELKVLEKNKWRLHRWILAVTFAAIGFGGLISNTIQKNEDKKARQSLNAQVAQLNDEVSNVEKKLTDNQRASVGLSNIAAWPNQELAPDKKVRFQIQYAVESGVARNYRGFHEIFSLAEKQSEALDKRAIKIFRQDSVGKFDYRGEDRISGTGSQRTLEIKFG